MSRAQRQFGRRESRVYHGAIALNARKRVYCTIVRRLNRIIFFEIAEPVHIPFSFRIDFDYDSAWIDCEFKSQNGGLIVAQMVSASFDAIKSVDTDPQTRSSGIDLADREAWRGGG